MGGPKPDHARVVVEMTASVADLDDRLAFVEVNGVRLDALVYEHYQRDTQDWSNGIRLMDPGTGDWLRDDVGYPADLLAAGARSIKVVGLGFHPESQSPAFGLGQSVRLVADPRNPVDRNAIAVTNADGKLMAGYVPADDLERIRAVVPQPVTGLVVWENYTWRPRRRLGMRLLIGASLRWEYVSARQEPAERARREAAYVVGRERHRVAMEAERAQAEVGRQAALEARRQAKSEERTVHHAEQAHLEDERRAAGLCVACGGPMEELSGRGRPPIRCANCRAAPSR